MNQYKCLENQRFDKDAFSLVPIRAEDIQKIRVWRNEQMRILRQNEYITAEKQDLYYENQIFPDFNLDKPKQILFSYLKNNELIGYGGLVHFSWVDKRAEVSFLLNTNFIKDTQIHDWYFENFLYLIQKVAFEDLKLLRLHTEVYNSRQHHIAILEKCGFLLEGRLRSHVCIEGEMIDSLLHGKLKNEYKF
jgi:RimJ/RimL family protein N-acetyltransferase